MDSQELLEPDVMDCDERGRRSWLLAPLVLFAVAAVCTLALYVPLRTGVFALELADRMVSREVLATSESPDGQWTVRVEYVNPGAMASASYVVTAKSASTGRDTHVSSCDGSGLAWEDESPIIEWVDSDTIRLGTYTIDIEDD